MKEDEIMVKYYRLGYSTFEEYFDDFICTLLPTNKTYSYFVDWDKVRGNIEKYREGLELLSSLYGKSKEEAKDELRHMLVENPNLFPILPILVAERLERAEISIYDPEMFEFVTINFEPTSKESDEFQKILKFCEQTGILDVLTTVADLENYVLGVEVGLDTNARKGRSGKIFEDMVEKFLKNKVPEYIEIISQDPNFSLYEATSRSKTPKKHDFVVYKEGNPVAVIEANFYNTTGSKPLEIARSYTHLHRIAKEKNICFIWITDGPAWKKMAGELKITMQNIDWVVNYTQLPRLIKFFDSVDWELTQI